MCWKLFSQSCMFNKYHFTALRRDLVNENEAPQSHSNSDSELGVSGYYHEGYLDGPYDYAYSRIDRYMDTQGKTSQRYGMKAQMLIAWKPPGKPHITYMSICLQYF